MRLRSGLKRTLGAGLAAFASGWLTWIAGAAMAQILSVELQWYVGLFAIASVAVGNATWLSGYRWAWFGRPQRQSLYLRSALLGVLSTTGLFALVEGLHNYYLFGWAVGLVAALASTLAAVAFASWWDHGQPLRVAVVTDSDPARQEEAIRMTTEHATQYWWPSAARVVRAEAEPGRLIDWSRHEQLFNVDVVVAFMQSQRELRRLERSLEGTRAILLTHPFIDPRHASPRTTIWEGSVAILPRRHMRLQLLLKRAIDWIFAFGLILVLAPVLVAIGLAIRLDSRGPVLFRQARVGRAGAPFYMLKFRTMIVGADLVRNLATDERGKDSQFRIRADPRITRVGAFLRRLSLDELPNIFNVLAGSMSLVGPRPALPLEAEMYDEESARRLSVKPGITGLWQVSGRSDLSWEKSVQLDLWYVDNWSLLLDARILLRTVRVVFAGHGAY